MDTNTTSIEEKKAYVARIEKKAKDENISIKYASQKLGSKVWLYYNYRRDITAAAKAAEKAAAVDEPARPPTALQIHVSDTCMAYLSREAESYAVDEATVAQLLLHDCIAAKFQKHGGSIKPPMPET